MTAKGVVFDFNGTLFWDTAKHEVAWRQYLNESLGRAVTDKEFETMVHGRNNSAIFAHFAGRPLTGEETDAMTEKKEAIYRALCLSDPAGLHLAPGAAALLDTLCAKGVPVNIATASGRGNVDFYFEQFGLSRWFARERVVYDNGTFPGKPKPDIYLLAMKAIGVAPADTVVFEDVPNGVLAAAAAGAGAVIAVCGDTGRPATAALPEVTLAVRDFTDAAIHTIL